MPARSQNHDTLGDKLRKKREALGLSQEDLAHLSQLSSKQISALEGDAYETFSAKVYAAGSLKKIINALSYALADQERILLEFSSEWEVRNFRKPKETTPLPRNRVENPYFTPFRISLGLTLIGFTALAVFFAFRITNFVGSPKLNIFEPEENSQWETLTVRVQGETEKESTLTINGREVTINERGEFNQELSAQPGLNVLEFRVEDRFGKVTQKIRHIVVK